MSEPDESEDITQLALAASRSYAERRTAETFLDDREYMLYSLIEGGAAQLTEEGNSATFTREWVDDLWRGRRERVYAKDPDAPFPGSVEEFVEGYFKGLLPWRDALTQRGRARRSAGKALREEWRQTGRMQLGETLAGILRRSGRLSP